MKVGDGYLDTFVGFAREPRQAVADAYRRLEEKLGGKVESIQKINTEMAEGTFGYVFTLTIVYTRTD